MSRMPTTPLDVRVAMDTDIGRKRKQNQDAIGHLVPSDPAQFEALGQIFVLADGVGGLAGGDLASQYAVSTIISSYYEQEDGDPADRLARAIAEANNVIYAQGQDQDAPGKMATTVVCAVVCGSSLIIGSVGDSPAYLMRSATARKLTLDHNVETMQREAGTPLADGDPTAHKLVRALGKEPSVKVDIISGRVRDGDHVVLCSDGLTRYVSPEEIEQTVATRAPERAVKALIQTANERGGADNISVIVLRIAAIEELVLAGAVGESDPIEDYLAVADPYRSSPRAPDADLIDRDSARARRAARTRRATQLEQTDNPLADLLALLRSNIVITAAGLTAVGAVFIIIMLAVTTLGGGDDDGTEAPAAPAGPTQDHTATAQLAASATSQIAAVQTNDALAEDNWFRVQPGDPVPAFAAPDVNAEEATPLEPGAAYLIQGVDTEAWNGPWYWVVDNQGVELRWVNGPSLHQRVLLVSSTGEPLPQDQQPTDIPPGIETPTPQPTPEPVTPSPASDTTDTPGEAAPETPAAPGTPTATVPVAYAAEAWEPGIVVFAQADFLLRPMPSLSSDETNAVTMGEPATVMQGPVSADGHWWWRLRFDDGRTGWVAQPLLSFNPVN
jgi:serine/threonine protein phosphatase PrpC